MEVWDRVCLNRLCNNNNNDDKTIATTSSIPLSRTRSVRRRSVFQQVTIQSLSGLLFLATMGQIMGDVMADTLVCRPPCSHIDGRNIA